MNVCQIHGIIIETTCKKCFPDGKTPAWKFAKTGLALMTLPIISFIFAAPFLFESAELAMIRDAVILPLLAIAGAAVTVGVVAFGFMFLCASLPARNVRLKLK